MNDNDTPTPLKSAIELDKLAQMLQATAIADKGRIRAIAERLMELAGQCPDITEERYMEMRRTLEFIQTWCTVIYNKPNGERVEINDFSELPICRPQPPQETRQ